MTPEAAVAAFKKTFKSKSSVYWEDRFTMVAKPGKYASTFVDVSYLFLGKYTWIERSFEEAKEIPVSEKEEELIIPDSKLEPAVQVCTLLLVQLRTNIP